MGVIKRTLQCISCKKDIEYYIEEKQKIEEESVQDYKEEEKIDPAPQAKTVPMQKTGTDDLFADFYATSRPSPRLNVKPNSDDLDAPSFKRFQLD